MTTLMDGPITIEVHVDVGDLEVRGTLVIRPGQAKGRPRLAPDERKPKQRTPHPRVSDLTGRPVGRPPGPDLVGLIRRLGNEGGGHVHLDEIVEHAIAAGFLMPAERGTMAWRNRQTTVKRRLVREAPLVGVAIEGL